jgi:hypothetical protein
MKCRHCGKENPSNFKFCLDCGSTLEQPECPKCGVKNAAGAVKCALCDEPLGSPAESIDAAPVVQKPFFSSGPEPAGSVPAPRPAKAKPVMALALVLMIAGVVFGVWITMRSSDPAGSPESPTPKAAPAEAPLLAEGPGKPSSDPAEFIMNYIREVMKILKANLGDCEKAVQEANAYSEKNKAAFQEARIRFEGMGKKLSREEMAAYHERTLRNMEAVLKETMEVMAEFTDKCPDASEKLDGILGP